MLSSRAAQGGVTRTAYSATKGRHHRDGADLGARARAARHHVNAVAPGPVGSTRDVSTRSFRRTSRNAHWRAPIPMGRLGRPEDVANAVLFFASPHSGFVTGQTLYVCGRFERRHRSDLNKAPQCASSGRAFLDSTASASYMARLAAYLNGIAGAVTSVHAKAYRRRIAILDG